jgi:RND family efflux transporter MFP subunit
VTVPRVQPGIYRAPLTLETAGEYHGKVVIGAPSPGTIDGWSIVAHPDEETASKSATEPDDTSTIELLKEQQWGVPFATAFARADVIVGSTIIAGKVTAPPGALGQVGAPVAGRLIAPRKGMPRPGQTVKKGQALASLAPAPAAPEAAARARLAVVEARARAGRASAALERAQRLVKDDALPKRDLEEAEREATVADEAVKAAERAEALFSGVSRGGRAGAWRLTAPIDGVLTKVSAVPGAAVSPGDVLFEVLDSKELWLTAKVPEQDAARLRVDRDAAYQVAGLDEWRPIVVSGESPTAALISVGSTVDPVSRTVDVIYSLQVPDPTLRVGGLVRISVPTGADFEGVVVPLSAIVEDEGRQVVYVQVDGEHFVERVVRTSVRTGDRIGIARGVDAGERIVTRGAHLVRLADRAKSSGAHGHIH